MTRALAVVSCAALLAACESNEVQTTTRNLDRAWDLALVCAVSATADGTTTWTGTTADQCASEAEGHLFAFVIEAARGELAALDLRTKRMLDLDPREPLHSPVAVGPVPSAIAASADGARLVVANLGDPRPGEDPENPDGLPYLSVVDPGAVLTGWGAEPSRVYLPAPAAHVAFLDEERLVATLPALSAVVLVSFAEDPPAVGQPLVLEPFPLVGPLGETLEGLPRPWSVAADEVRGRILVGDRDRSRLARLLLDEHGVLAVETGVDVPGPVEAMAVEPPVPGPEGAGPGRWIYAADGRSGGVMVLDGDTLAPLDLSSRDPLEWRDEIFASGMAHDVAIGVVTLPDAAEEEAAPELLHGRFAFIVTSTGGVYAVDIEDRHNPECWVGGVPGEGGYDETKCPRHVLRSAVWPAEVPHWSGAPELFLPTDAPVVYDEAPDPLFPIFDGWAGMAGEERTYGVAFDPDPRRGVNQVWTFEYEAAIPWTDGNAGNVDDGGDFSDRAMPFCGRGVLGATADYPGDVLVVSDGPNPLDETADCRVFGSAENPATMEYRIVEAYSDRLRIEPLGVDGAAPLPTEECFPYAVSYEIRVAGQWLVEGSSTGFAHHVIADAGGRCVEEPVCAEPVDCTTPPSDFRCLHAARATEGVRFRNPYICFRMVSGMTATPRGLRYEMTATGGFEALAEDAGEMGMAVALDATTRTGPALLVVDSSSDGLSRLDLNGFTISDVWE
jgi:hypothetical protein